MATMINNTIPSGTAQQKQVGQPRAGVTQPTAAAPTVGSFNPNQYTVQSATIDDIAKKYGFDYSKDYANQQAEIIRKQKEDGLNETKNRANNDLMSAADSLDRNYFQQYQKMMQNQANGGVNGALAADQSLRMNMARQADLGNAYRDNAAQNYEVNNQLGRLSSEATAYADQLYNDRLQQGFNNAMTYTNSERAQQQALMNAALGARGQDIGIDQFNQNMTYQKGRDTVNDNHWNQTFDYQKGRDNVADNQWNKSFAQQVAEANRAAAQWESSQKWGRQMDVAGLTGMYNGQATMDRQKWLKDLELEQQRLALQKQQAARAAQSSQGVTFTNPSAGSALDQWLQQYMNTLASQQQSPLDKYYTNPAVQAMEKAKAQDPTLNRIIGQPLPPAQNPNLSPWEKMKMFGG